MIEARPTPQYLHTFLHAVHPTTASTKIEYILEDFAPTASSSSLLAPAISLSEADHECHHEREQPGSFSEGKPQNGIREQLSPQARVASRTANQSPKNRSNTHTGSRKTDCSKTRTNVSTSDDQGFSELGGKWADDLRREGGLEGVADLLTFKGLEGSLGGVVMLEGAAHT